MSCENFMEAALLWEAAVASSRSVQSHAIPVGTQY